jgi:hypothetical protein
MGEQLTIKIEKSLKDVLLRYCKAVGESPSSVVDRALKEFMAKAQGKGGEKWFGLPAEDYLALPEDAREALWNRVYGVELDSLQLAEREVQPHTFPPRQRGRETLRRRIREIRKKSAAHH